MIGHTIAHHFNEDTKPGIDPSICASSVLSSVGTENKRNNKENDEDGEDGDFKIIMTHEEFNGKSVADLRKLSSDLGLDTTGIRDKESLRELIAETPGMKLVDKMPHAYHQENARKLIEAVKTS